jgi:hypothetical protein
MTDEVNELKREVAQLKSLVVEGLMVQNGAQILQLFQNHRGHLATSLVALSFIIEKLGVTVDDVAARFAAVRKTLGENYATPHVDVMVELVLDALRTAYSSSPATKPAPSWAPRVIDGGA